MPLSGAARPARVQPTSAQPGALGAIARFLQRSYGLDWVGFLLLQTGYILINKFVLPFHRMFALDDPSIQYPHALIQRVPSFMNIVYAGFVPLAILILWALLVRPGLHKSHVTILGLLISHALTSFLTDVVKNAIGRPRPDLIARCKPEPGTPEHNLITFLVCTETDRHTLHDGWRSFPSGHSSFAFAGLGYLGFFFAGQLHAFRAHMDLIRMMIAVAPLVGAAMIAMSRMADYRHDVYDVTVGSILGVAMAYFSYRRFYPSPRSWNCDVPYPIRGTVTRGTARQGVDEESQLRDAEDFQLGELVEADEDGFSDEENRPLNPRRGHSEPEAPRPAQQDPG